MRTHILEQYTVDTFLDKVPEAANAFRRHNIDPTTRMSFANAAAAVSAPTDEVLAVMEARLRRAARQAPRIEQPDVQTIPVEIIAEAEGELVA
jgi:hypothetical protein